MATVTPKFTLERAPRQYKFVLTPLADAMFQLLIFFMLSSSLAPYALMTIRSGSSGDFANAPGGEAQSTATTFADVSIWNITSDGVTVSGQAFGFEALPSLTAAMANQDTTILLILRETAIVQDLARVVEALTTAGITNVQIAGQTS